MIRIHNIKTDVYTLTDDHQKVLDVIIEQDEVFLEFISAKLGISTTRANNLMAEIAIMTGKYIPEIAWTCDKCNEVSRIPLKDGLRIATLGGLTVKCCECSNIVGIKAIDTIVTWKLLE